MMCFRSGAFVRALPRGPACVETGSGAGPECIAMAVMSRPGRPQEGGCASQGTLRPLSKLTPRPVSEPGPDQLPGLVLGEHIWLIGQRQGKAGANGLRQAAWLPAPLSSRVAFGTYLLLKHICCLLEIHTEQAGHQYFIWQLYPGAYILLCVLSRVRGKETVHNSKELRFVNDLT